MDIGVIGGGASAVCLLDALSQGETGPPGLITIFEPSRHLWRGRAYQPDADSVRVNAPPRDMSVRGGDPEHFNQWLMRRRVLFGFDDTYLDPRAGIRFVPRAVYGDYLEQSARSALLRLGRQGWRFQVVREYVVAATVLGGSVLLRTEHGDDVQVDRAVLCFGSGRPNDAYSLAGRPGFVADPYPVMRQMTGIGADKAVAVIGSGLTAIDATLALAEAEHRGPIMLVSRSGVLPSVRQRPIHHRLRHFTPQYFQAAAAAHQALTLADVARLLGTELADAGEDIGTLRAEIDKLAADEPVARLRRQLAEVDAPGMAMRILQQAVPECGPDVWTALRGEERELFVAKHYRIAMSLCCPMPPTTAEKLLGLFDDGRLSIVRGVRTVEAQAGGGFSIVTDAGVRHADIVVNGVNARLRSFSGDAAPLITSLVAERLAELHPHGGLALERATSRLTVHGVPQDRLYALGDPGAGSLFFTFGIESLVDRAVDIARSLADSSAAIGRRAPAGYASFALQVT